MTRRISRRTFVGSTVGAAGACLINRVWGQSAAPRPSTSPTEKLNVAIIGAMGRGQYDTQQMVRAGCNIVALCDVDEDRLNEAGSTHLRARKYQDFRKLLEQKDIDGVCVATPDHTHAIIALMAMKLGKHVYCETPLAHSIYEVRKLTEAAAQLKVATQMGQQGHASEGTRTTVEWLAAGAIGAVKEVHAWTDRSGIHWPQGIPRPKDKQPVPPGLNWDLWLGPAPARPFHKAYHPAGWRGFVDFGNGALGDVGCQVLEAAYWALNLRDPEWIESEHSGFNGETYPASAIIHYHFGKRADLPPVDLYWYDGGNMPPRPPELEGNRPLPAEGGALFIGETGKLLAPTNQSPLLLPAQRQRDYKRPEPMIARSPGHFVEWVISAKGGKPAGSRFASAAPLAELVLLGNLAMRLGKRVEWDAKTATAKDDPRAASLIHPEYHRGWEL